MGRPRKNPEPDLYQAKETFTTFYQGAPKTVYVGEVIRRGHPLYEQCAPMFSPLEVKYELAEAEEPVVEQATAAPGEVRG